jgi:hypothetical protein
MVKASFNAEHGSSTKPPDGYSIRGGRVGYCVAHCQRPPRCSVVWVYSSCYQGLADDPAQYVQGHRSPLYGPLAKPSRRTVWLDLDAHLSQAGSTIDITEVKRRRERDAGNNVPCLMSRKPERDSFTSHQPSPRRGGPVSGPVVRGVGI